MRKILLLMVLALFVGTVSAEMTGTAPNHQELGDITYSSSLSIGTNAGLNNAIRSTIFNPALRCDDVLPSGTTQQSFSRQNLPYQGTALSGRISRLRRSYPAARIQDSEWNNMIGELLNLISEKTSAVCFTTAVSGQVASQPQHDVLLNQLSSLLNLLGQYWQQPSTDAGLAERDRIAAQISAGTADSQEETGTPECEIDSENTDKVHLYCSERKIVACRLGNGIIEQNIGFNCQCVAGQDLNQKTVQIYEDKQNLCNSIRNSCQNVNELNCASLGGSS